MLSKHPSMSPSMTHSYRRLLSPYRYIGNTHSSVLLSGLKPLELGRKSASKIGSRHHLQDHLHYPILIVGMPIGRFPPLAFGMYFLSTGEGRYVRCFSSVRSSSTNLALADGSCRSAPHTPSTPEVFAPALSRTASRAELSHSLFQSSEWRLWNCLFCRRVAVMASPLWMRRMALPSSLRTTGFGDCSPILIV